MVAAARVAPVVVAAVLAQPGAQELSTSAAEVAAAVAAVRMAAMQPPCPAER
jgi:hypothetical protein